MIDRLSTDAVKQQRMGPQFQHLILALGEFQVRAAAEADAAEAAAAANAAAAAAAEKSEKEEQEPEAAGKDLMWAPRPQGAAAGGTSVPGRKAQDSDGFMQDGGVRTFPFFSANNMHTRTLASTRECSVVLRGETRARSLSSAAKTPPAVALREDCVSHKQADPIQQARDPSGPEDLAVDSVPGQLRDRGCTEAAFFSACNNHTRMLASTSAGDMLLLRSSYNVHKPSSSFNTLTLADNVKTGKEAPRAHGSAEPLRPDSSASSRSCTLATRTAKDSREPKMRTDQSFCVPSSACQYSSIPASSSKDEPPEEGFSTKLREHAQSEGLTRQRQNDKEADALASILQSAASLADSRDDSLDQHPSLDQLPSLDQHPSLLPCDEPGPLPVRRRSTSGGRQCKLQYRQGDPSPCSTQNERLRVMDDQDASTLLHASSSAVAAPTRQGRVWTRDTCRLALAHPHAYPASLAVPQTQHRAHTKSGDDADQRGQENASVLRSHTAENNTRSKHSHVISAPTFDSAFSIECPVKDAELAPDAGAGKAGTRVFVHRNNGVPVRKQ